MGTQRKNNRFHIFMVIMVVIWGLELPVAKGALEAVSTFPLLSIRLAFGIVILGTIAKASDQLHIPCRRDFAFLLGSAVSGHILYYVCEYSALDTISVANITIVFSFLPIATALLEKLLFGRRISGLMTLFMICCVLGISLIVGQDLISGKLGSVSGYLCCLGSLVAWICYLFLTEKVSGNLGALAVAFWQVVIAFCIICPYTLTHFPPLEAFSPAIIVQLLYLAIIGEGVGFLIEVNGIEKLGPTISAVYSNFLPVSTGLFGLLLLGQQLSMLQITGGIVVIVSGIVVVREKARINADI